MRHDAADYASFHLFDAARRRRDTPPMLMRRRDTPRAAR